MVRSDKPPLWHSYTYTIHLGIFFHPCFEVGILPQVTWRPPSSKCPMTSCPHFYEAKCGHFSWDFWTHLWCPVPAKPNVDVLSHDFGHICDVLSAVKHNVDVYSHDFWTHLRWHPDFGQVWDEQPTVKQKVDMTQDFVDTFCMTIQLTGQSHEVFRKVFGFENLSALIY
jgi:hypothetical protein